jgi:protein phosphatase
VRRNNEDSLAIEEGLGLLIVADGMGGHKSGEVASAMAVAIIQECARRTSDDEEAQAPEGADGGRLPSPRGRRLERFIKTANAAIYEKGRASIQDAGMGTTVVAVWVDDISLSVAHVGDSRLYLLRQGVLTRLTEDHSLAAQQNILTRAVGAEAEVKVDVAEHAVWPGDKILLASDGLTKMVADEEIARVLRDVPAPGRAAAALVERALQAGGIDNVTVLCGAKGSARAPGLWGKARGLFRGD